jgi:NAD(P)H-nitrite reductase large subunit
MNNVGHIENNFRSYSKNKSEIKPIKKIEKINSFKDYMKQNKKICSCFNLTEEDLSQYKTYEEVIDKTGASTRCTACLKDLKNYYLQPNF